MNIEKSQLSEDQNDSSESYKPEKLKDVRKKRATNRKTRAKNEEPKDKTKSKKTKNSKPQNKRQKKEVPTQSEKQMDFEFTQTAGEKTITFRGAYLK